MATERVKAGPTKQFFVKMLTRDIDLKDAILDLLDNCVDGILREIKRTQSNNSNRPYEGYWAKLFITPNSFEIVDNCGGIPKDIAINSAFMLGRPNLEQDEDIETVGMYGIGMKRAIFKMGRRCHVISHHLKDSYRVDITPEWLDSDDDNWDLSLRNVRPKLKENGTKIKIEELYGPIQTSFDEKSSSFMKDFKTEISQLYAIIMEKGFKVYLNEEEIKPVGMTLLSPTKKYKGVPAIEPYLFEGEIDDVNISLCVGFYRKLATEKELDKEMQQKRSKDAAGWTIICNDRVVLHKDKSLITGWGTANVPQYHNQFIAISGFVSFHSKKSLNLPLNTTKRGIEGSSEVYLMVLDIMREGVKTFTSFTYKWKKNIEESSDNFNVLESVKPSELAKRASVESWTVARKIRHRGSGKKYIPQLPVPTVNKTSQKIVFTRLTSEIKLLSNYLFDRSDVKGSEVGEYCFETVLEEAKSERC